MPAMAVLGIVRVMSVKRPSEAAQLSGPIKLGRPWPAHAKRANSCRRVLRTGLQCQRLPLSMVHPLTPETGRGHPDGFRLTSKPWFRPGSIMCDKVRLWYLEPWPGGHGPSSWRRMKLSLFAREKGDPTPTGQVLVRFWSGLVVACSLLVSVSEAGQLQVAP